jgi:hypothetical protein
VKNRIASVFVAVLATPALYACVSTPVTEPVSSDTVTKQSDTCDSKKVARYVGKRFTAVLAEQMRKDSGAAIVRTGPKDSPVTMDYVAARLNIFYDDAVVIAIISCG